MKNDGEYPLPSKSTGEGGMASANVDGPVKGRNGQGPAPMGDIKQPIHADGVGGQGKEVNPIPRNQSGAR
jgi:hypothetical protein